MLAGSRAHGPVVDVDAVDGPVPAGAWFES